MATVEIQFNHDYEMKWNEFSDLLLALTRSGHCRILVNEVCFKFPNAVPNYDFETELLKDRIYIYQEEDSIINKKNAFRFDELGKLRLFLEERELEFLGIEIEPDVHFQSILKIAQLISSEDVEFVLLRD